MGLEHEIHRRKGQVTSLLLVCQQVLLPLFLYALPPVLILTYVIMFWIKFYFNPILFVNLTVLIIRILLHGVESNSHRWILGHRTSCRSTCPLFHTNSTCISSVKWLDFIARKSSCFIFKILLKGLWIFQQ